MLPSFKTAAIAGLVAAAVAAAPVAPAYALGKREQDFLKGALAAAAVGAVLYNMNQQRQRTVPSRQYYNPVPAAPPVYRQPAYSQPAYRQPVYTEPTYRQPTYDSARYIPEPQTSPLYSTPAARAFNSYTLAQRRTIQSRLSAMGYYRSGIDGQFGPGTHAAISAYARDQGLSDRLASTDQVFGVFDGLIY